MPKPDPAPQRARTADRGPPSANRAPIHTIGLIGPKRKILADGSLLCEDVPIARTGTMMYAPGEVPVLPPKRPGAQPVVYITRDRTALFSPMALGSVVGCAITNDHPPVDVTPENWNQLSGGFILDAWQGEGPDGDIMFADLVIKDRGLISRVNDGALPEVSLGYTASYAQTGDGEGRQSNIIINHLALVERGRCGPRCSIGDRETPLPEGEDMPRTPEGQQAPGGARPRARLDEIRASLDALEQEDEDGVHVHVHMPQAATRDHETVDDPDEVRTTDALDARLDAVEEGMVEQRAMLQTILDRLATPPGTTPAVDTQRAPTGDSAALQASFQQMIAQAEILVPGFQAPTFDSALPRTKTVDHMCATRRQVLTQLKAAAGGDALLGQVTDESFDLASSGCEAVAVVFKAAATLKSGSNNRAATGDRLTVPRGAAAIQPVTAFGGVKPISGDEINDLNRKYWANR